jgi:hypothetical protein
MPETPTVQKKGISELINSTIGTVIIWWNTHHTTRKAIENAVFGCVSAVAVALAADPSLLQNTNLWYVGVVLVVLKAIANWASHNVGQ